MALGAAGVLKAQALKGIASVSKMQAGRAASVSHACSHAFVMRSLVPARHEMVVGAVWGPTALGDAMLSAAALALDMTVSRQGCTCTVVIFCFCKI